MYAVCILTIEVQLFMRDEGNNPYLGIRHICIRYGYIMNVVYCCRSKFHSTVLFILHKKNIETYKHDIQIKVRFQEKYKEKKQTKFHVMLDT